MYQLDRKILHVSCFIKNIRTAIYANFVILFSFLRLKFRFIKSPAFFYKQVFYSSLHLHRDFGPRKKRAAIEIHPFFRLRFFFRRQFLIKKYLRILKYSQKTFII